MRNLIVLLLGVGCAFVSSVSSAWGAEYSYLFDFSPADVTLSSVGSGETFVSLKDGEFGEGNPGKAWLPYKVFSVRLPAGEVLSASSVEVGETMLLAENVVPVPEQLPVPTSAKPGEYPPVPRDESAYASPDPYPALRGEHLHTGNMRGIKIASFRVSPLWYVGAEKKLYLAKSVTVKFVTESSAEPSVGGTPTVRGGRSASVLAVADEESGEMPVSSLFESAVNSLVVNPTPSVGSKGASLLSVSKSGSGCQYLVITTRALATAAQRLADFRASFDNVTTAVVAIEDIEANASWSGVRPDGKTDVPTKIRNCITWYVQNKGTEYVVLAGDDTVVPKRGVHVKCGEKEYTDAPSDLYYSDLDGTWDQNQDGDYAYTTASDGTDLYPDVIVGRIPVRNASQLAHYIDKVVAYERGTTDDSDIVRKALWMGHTQWQDLKRTSSGWVSVEGSVEDAKYRSFTETFNDGLFEVKDRPVGSAATDAEVWTRRLNQSWHRTYRPNIRSAFLNTSATSWDTKSLGDFKKTYGEGGTIHAVLNQGWHQLWVSCHGVPSQWVLKDSYRNSDAVTLTNRVDFVYTISCLTAAFDDSVDPCLSESFLRAPSGAVAYIGCSREGWGTKMTKSSYDDWVRPGNVSGYSERYAVEFWRRVFDKGDKKIGPAFAAHKSAKVSSSSSTGADRWLQLLLNLQGDPLLTYHLPPDKTKEPDTRADGKPGLVTLLRDNLPETTSSSVSVRLAADAIPLGSSATVALEYSKSSTFSSATSVTVDAAVKKAGEYEKELAGLSPATDYHVRGMITIDGVTHLSPFSLTLTTKSADYVSPTPVIAPASGSFSGKLTVTMTSAASDVTIRYTTDGSEPTAASRAYEGPFVIDFTTDFRAVAFRDGVRLGGVAQATYTYAAEVGTPKGDLFADPIVIRGESGVLTIPSLPLYSVEAGEIDHTQGKRDTPVRKSIWLEWTAPGSGEVSFTSRCMNGSVCLGSALAVYTGDTMSALALVAESRATSLNDTGNPNLSFTAVEGTTYRIAPLSWLTGTDPYSCIVTWEGSLTSDGSYVDPGFPGPGTNPDPGSGTDPEPQDAYASYRKTDGTPQSILLSYYDGPDTRGFAWQTSVDTTTGALWILAGNYGASADAQFATNQVATATSAKQSECYTHKAHVLGLKPGVYSYRLGTEGHFAYGSFTVKAETNPFVALNVNDVQTKVAERIDCWDRTLAAAKSVLGSASNVDMILSGGDFIDNAFSYSDYLEWGVAADRARPSFADVPWTMASGNHDPSLYNAVIDENFQHTASGHWGCHSYDVGNVHVVNLPYYSSWIAEVGTWLEADLAACTSKWRVVMMHYGPYTTVDHGSTAGETFVKAVSGICAKGKVDLVLQAHDHGYSKTLPYLWSGAGYAMSDSDKATTVNVAPTVESIGGESYYKDPKGTVYISAGCAGHRVGEGKSYATTAYKSRSTKIFVDTIKVGSSAGAEASLVPDNQMFGVLKVDGDKLAYDWYLAETDGSATLFDSLRLYKTAASDEPDPGDDPGPGGDDPGPGPGPGDEPGPEENYVRWSTYKIPYGGLAKGIENYDGTTDTVLVFTNGVGSFSLPAQAQAKVLVVGGGGGAGGGYKTDSGSLYFGIGGNGGSVVEKSLLLTNSSYVVSVGAGGLGGDGNGIAGGNDAGQSGTVSGIWTGSAAIVTAQPGMGGKGGETANQKGTGGSAGAPTTGVTSTVYSGTYGKGGRDASNTSKGGDSAAANTGDGGRGARDRFSGGAGGSGIVVVRITAMSGEVVDPGDDPGDDPGPDPAFETVQETLFFTEISKHVLSTTNGASAAWVATATGGVRLMQNATTAVTELSVTGASFALPINGYTGDSTGTVTVTCDGVKVAVYEATVLADLDETAASAQWRSAVKTETLRVGESLTVSFCHPSSAKYWRYADGMYNDTTRMVYTYSGTATVVTDPVCTESASAFYTTAATRNFAATFTATEPGTVFVAVLFGSNASNQRHYAGVYEITVTGSGSSESWDVPGTAGGINGIADGKGGKSVRFTSIALVDGKLTLGLEAGQVDADGQVFGLVCKENLTDAQTFTVNVTLKNGAAATLGTLEGLTDKPQLFILGLGPKE